MHASVLRGCTEIPPLVRKCDLRYERGYFRERYFSARNKFRAKNDRFSSRRARRELCEAFDQWQPSASQSLPVRAKSFRSVFPATCAVKKLLRAYCKNANSEYSALPCPRHPRRGCRGAGSAERAGRRERRRRPYSRICGRARRRARPPATTTRARHAGAPSTTTRVKQE